MCKDPPSRSALQSFAINRNSTSLRREDERADSPVSPPGVRPIDNSRDRLGRSRLSCPLDRKPQIGTTLTQLIHMMLLVCLWGSI